MSPYIKREDRIKWRGLIDLLDAVFKTVPEERVDGEMNFVISTLLNRVYERDGKRCYKDFNRMMGVLSCATHEAYRRRIGPYEDIKIEENGDIVE